MPLTVASRGVSRIHSSSSALSVANAEPSESEASAGGSRLTSVMGRRKALAPDYNNPFERVGGTMPKPASVPHGNLPTFGRLIAPEYGDLTRRCRLAGGAAQLAVTVRAFQRYERRMGDLTLEQGFPPRGSKVEESKVESACSLRLINDPFN